MWTSCPRWIPRSHRRIALSQAFLAMVRERRGHDLEAWMTAATDSGIDALARFARGLQEDLAAVTAGLTLDWSNGPVEGQITRLKLLKRQGYGRAGFRALTAARHAGRLGAVTNGRSSCGYHVLPPTVAFISVWRGLPPSAWRGNTTRSRPARSRRSARYGSTLVHQK